MADMETPRGKTEEKKEDKKGGAALPTLKDTTQTLRKPVFKIRDMSTRTVVDRFKQFRKKDLAFIMAGLGVLFAAPMAEHYLMSPSHGPSDVFKEGWGFHPGVGGLGAGGSPFDTGGTGFSPGSPTGESGDIITPANFRDPASLILGPEAEAQPPATTSNAPATDNSNSGSGSGWKNALAEAGSGAAQSALGSAGLPTPALTLSKNMLNGLTGLGGGTHASYSLPKISAANVPNRGNVNNSLAAVKPAPGFAGVRSLTGGSGGSPESLKEAGAAAASNFTAANGAKGLQNAAAVKMPTANPSAFGGPGANKNTGLDSAKTGKNIGESLAFMAAKQNMQKAIDLQWKLKEKNAMMWPNIKEKMMTDMITKPVSAMADAIGAGMSNWLSGPGGDQYCCSPLSAPTPGPGGSCPANAMVETATACGTKSDPKSNLACANSDGTIERGGSTFFCFKMGGGNSGGASDSKSSGGADQGVNGVGAAANSCKVFNKSLNEGGGTAAASTAIDQNALSQICPAVDDANTAAQSATSELGSSQ